MYENRRAESAVAVEAVSAHTPHTMRAGSNGHGAEEEARIHPHIKLSRFVSPAEATGPFGVAPVAGLEPPPELLAVQKRPLSEAAAVHLNRCSRNFVVDVHVGWAGRGHRC